MGLLWRVVPICIELRWKLFLVSPGTMMGQVAWRGRAFILNFFTDGSVYHIYVSYYHYNFLKELRCVFGAPRFYAI